MPWTASALRSSPRCGAPSMRATASCPYNRWKRPELRARTLSPTPTTRCRLQRCAPQVCPESWRPRGRLPRRPLPGSRRKRPRLRGSTLRCRPSRAPRSRRRRRCSSRAPPWPRSKAHGGRRARSLRGGRRPRSSERTAGRLESTSSSARPRRRSAERWPTATPPPKRTLLRPSMLPPLSASRTWRAGVSSATCSWARSRRGWRSLRRPW
mmetsp:Transcript_77300/g.224257  ORF Transcript_77300/g.224257 Transcript_77300/m.224257 type:complete len:210 (+) Transcript_77300:472-1101(+)